MYPRSIFSFTPKRFFLLLTLLYISFIVVSTAIIYFVSFQINIKEIEEITNRMNENIRYNNGIWDLHYLNADPELPGTNSHYILSIDGYVIERWRALSGFLNTSDMQYLLQFTQPTTITAPTKEQWRMLSVPFKQGGVTMGVLTVSRHISEEDTISVIDQKLLKEVSFVKQKVQIKNGTLDISELDIRQTQYDVSFKLVDNYNNIIVKTNNSNSIERTPNYIDRSYVARELTEKKYRIIRDADTRVPYLVTHQSVRGKSGEIGGIIVVAKSLKELQNLLIIYVIGQSVLLAGLSPLLWILYKRITHKPTVRHLQFDAENGIIEINNDAVEIPLETHQYELVCLIFQDPEREWTVKEVTQKFDEQSGNLWRKVYDAMLLVNKRVEPHLRDKLIAVSDKKFSMNPRLKHLMK